MTRVKVTVLLETTADLKPTRVIRGNYKDPHFVDALFRTSIARYEADEFGKMLAFEIERMPDTH